MWQVKMGEQKEDTSELSMKMGLDMALLNTSMSLCKLFKLKKKKSQLCPLVAVQCVKSPSDSSSFALCFWKKNTTSIKTHKKQTQVSM